MDVLMPQLGETVAEGKITKWFKAAGDKVAPGDNLFEIETDKTSMEVPAIAGGVLTEIRVREGDVVPVGAVVAILGGASEAQPAPAPPAAPAPQASSTPAANPPPTPAAQPAPTPAARPAAPVNVAPAASPAPPRPREPLDAFREVRTPERNFGTA